MYLRNVLRAGQYVQLVPVGLPLTLEYDENGILINIYEGFEVRKKVSDNFVDKVYEESEIPNTIMLRNGTTWVKGIFHINAKICSEGNFPECAYEEMYELFEKDSTCFSFYGLTATSNACSIKGAVVNRTWLESSGFKTLPGFLVPPDMSKEMFENIAKDKFPFKYPLIAYYLVFDGQEPYFINTGLDSRLVLRVSKLTDVNGYINAVLTFVSKDKLTVDYNQVVKYQINANSHLFLDMNKNIIFSETTDDKYREKRSNTIRCGSCGRKIIVRYDEPTICPDPHCASRMFPAINHMLTTLRLPTLSEENFVSYVSKKELTCMSDVFLLDNYKNMKVKASLGILLDSIVPVADVRDRSIFTLFANKCSNNLQTFRYYLTHPDKISVDLDIHGVACNQLIDWLKVPENYLVFDTVIQSDNVELDVTDRMYDGVPILKDNVIYLTGKFLHGDTSYIISILKSYDAKVVTDYDNSVDTVIVGGTHENINGQALRDAKQRNQRVFEENDFFRAYGIDNDIQENLQ